MDRDTRTPCITPASLWRLLDRGDAVWVIDARDGRAWDEAVEQIPGAVRAPTAVPSEHTIVVYDSGGVSEWAGVGVAADLRRAGIEDVYLLQGGFAAWLAAGYPTEVKGGAALSPTA
jgi:3-mercaptopyruvate sulfurtransferase SseA